MNEIELVTCMVYDIYEFELKVLISKSKFMLNHRSTSLYLSGLFHHYPALMFALAYSGPQMQNGTEIAPVADARRRLTCAHRSSVCSDF